VLTGVFGQIVIYEISKIHLMMASLSKKKLKKLKVKKKYHLCNGLTTLYFYFMSIVDFSVQL
jgi:hypothetical protein